jgi:thiamine-phosphate pyrophosphorylase
VALNRRFMVIGDRGLCDSTDAWIERLTYVARALLDVDGAMLQIRIKGLPPQQTDDLADLALAALEDTIAQGLTVLGNGATRTQRCAGVHLPQHDLEACASLDALRPGIVGASVHDRSALARAAQLGVDYVTVSPIFAPTWKAIDGKGIAWLAAMVKDAALPVLALGGGTPQRVVACLHAGASGVAVASSVMQAQEPEAMIGCYVAALDAYSRTNATKGVEHVL